MLSDKLSELVFQVAEMLPPAAITKLVADLEKLEDSPADSFTVDALFQALRRISARFPNASARYTIDRLFDTWREEKSTNQNLTLRDLTTALGILNFNRTKMGDRRKVELVWTGPASRIPVRQTRQVLSQIINGAEKELLIVSFVVFKIPEILELLKAALLRGVMITCVFESPEESDGKITFQGFADFNDTILKQIKILVWEREMRPASPDGKIGTLHAKVAVADRSVSFISSANLTVNAMTLNMELGLLLYDKGTAKEIVEHFDQLILSGVLKTREVIS